MSISELSNEMNELSMERQLRHQDSESADFALHDKGRLTRVSSTSSTGSSLDKRKLFYRKDSEVKIEAIFKELFSPDAKIVDHYDDDIVIPGLQYEEAEEEVAVPNHDRFKLRRQTSLLPKEETRKLSQSAHPRVRIVPRKSPAPMRKTSNPTLRKRSTSTKAPMPKLSAPPSLKPNFVTVSDDAPSYIRKNPIPLRRGLSVAQK